MIARPKHVQQLSITLYPSEAEKLIELKEKWELRSLSQVIRVLIKTADPENPPLTENPGIDL